MTVYADPGAVADVVGGGTPGRIEASWANAIRDRTIQRFATTADRDSAITSPKEGMFCYVTGTDSLYWYSGSAWVQTPLGAWISFTPTLITWTLGNGTLSGAYFRFGRFVEVACHLTVGSTTSTVGTLQFTPPAAALPATRRALGVATYVDASAGQGYYGDCQVYPNTITPATRNTSAQTVLLSATSPFTWATGDEIDLNVSYEAAS